MNETSKSVIRRLHNARFVNTYFQGDGIDIGAGKDSLSRYLRQFPLIKSLRSWDLPDGDAVHMNSVDNEKYDFVHSSHCLEHLSNPKLAFSNWLRICKMGGYLIITVPDEDLYEQGYYPSIFTREHLTSWTISKESSWSPTSINVFDFLNNFRPTIEILKVELINSVYMYDKEPYDQSLYEMSECAIEIVVRKRTLKEIAKKGRYGI